MGQKHDLKQGQNWRPTVLEWPVTLTGIWCFLHSTCEMIHIFVHKGKNCNNDTKNIRCHHTKLVIQDLCTPALHKDTSVWEKDSFIKWNIMLMYHCTDLRTLLLLTRNYMEHQHHLWLRFIFWPAVLLFYILITTRDLPSSHRYCPFPHMDLWYITPTFPSLNNSTSSYTPGSSVSYPAHTLLAVLFHVMPLKILLRSAVIHAHTYTGKF